MDRRPRCRHDDSVSPSTNSITRYAGYRPRRVIVQAPQLSGQRVIRVLVTRSCVLKDSGRFLNPFVCPRIYQW